MAKVSEKMAKGVKDTMAVVIAEVTGADQKEVRAWLDTVNTAQDFFGNNVVGMKEYQSFISAKENEYNSAVRRSKLRV
jgi:hypothetical protein